MIARDAATRLLNPLGGIRAEERWGFKKNEVRKRRQWRSRGSNTSMVGVLMLQVGKDREYNQKENGVEFQKERMWSGTLARNKGDG